MRFSRNRETYKNHGKIVDTSARAGLSIAGARGFCVRFAAPLACAVYKNISYAIFVGTDIESHASRTDPRGIPRRMTIKHIGRDA